MSTHVIVSPTEAADRLAIRELVEAYAHSADRRDAKGQMALFTPDTHFVVYMNAKNPKPAQELHSRDALAPVFADLNKYDATMHFVGQSTILSLTPDKGTGETYCLSPRPKTRETLRPSEDIYRVFVWKSEGQILFEIKNIEQTANLHAANRRSYPLGYG